MNLGLVCLFKVFEGTLTIFCVLKWFWDFGGGALPISLFSGGFVNYAPGSFGNFMPFCVLRSFLVDKVALRVVCLILGSWAAWLPRKAFLVFL